MNETLNNQMDIVIGDWSDDGHGKSKKIRVSTNKTKLEMQDAYLASLTYSHWDKKLNVVFGYGLFQ